MRMLSRTHADLGKLCHHCLCLLPEFVCTAGHHSSPLHCLCIQLQRLDNQLQATLFQWEACTVASWWGVWKLTLERKMKRSGTAALLVLSEIHQKPDDDTVSREQRSNNRFEGSAESSLLKRVMQGAPARAA